MKYLLSVIDDRTGSATSTEMAAIDAFNEWLQSQGHWVLAGGLESPVSATVIDNRGPQTVSSAGPFLESTEYLSGFWIIEAADREVAFELAVAGSKACNQRIEVRSFLGE
jgi:hypothetical protein